MSTAEFYPNSIHALYSNHRPWLQSWLSKKTGCAFKAEDLTQDTFVKVLLKPETNQMNEPRAYLVTIARGLLIDYWRREDIERAWRDSLQQLPTAMQPSVEEQQIALSFLQQIATMLEGLKPKVRMAFLLAQLEGMSHAEIASQMQVSQRTIERYVAEALYHLYILRYTLND
jgi:RNA polymerase sigma factor (sigma-70 family)